MISGAVGETLIGTHCVRYVMHPEDGPYLCLRDVFEFVCKGNSTALAVKIQKELKKYNLIEQTKAFGGGPGAFVVLHSSLQKHALPYLQATTASTAAWHSISRVARKAMKTGRIDTVAEVSTVTSRDIGTCAANFAPAGEEPTDRRSGSSTSSPIESVQSTTNPGNGDALPGSQLYTACATRCIVDTVQKAMSQQRPIPQVTDLMDRLLATLQESSAIDRSNAREELAVQKEYSNHRHSLLMQTCDRIENLDHRVLQTLAVACSPTQGADLPVTTPTGVLPRNVSIVQHHNGTGVSSRREFGQSTSVTGPEHLQSGEFYRDSKGQDHLATRATMLQLTASSPTPPAMESATPAPPRANPPAPLDDSHTDQEYSSDGASGKEEEGDDSTPSTSESESESGEEWQLPGRTDRASPESTMQPPQKRTRSNGAREGDAPKRRAHLLIERRLTRFGNMKHTSKNGRSIVRTIVRASSATKQELLQIAAARPSMQLRFCGRRELDSQYRFPRSHFQKSTTNQILVAVHELAQGGFHIRAMYYDYQDSTSL